MPKHLCRFTLWPSLYGQSPILVKQIKLRSITTPRGIAITASLQYFPKNLHISRKNTHVTLSSGTRKRCHLHRRLAGGSRGCSGRLQRCWPGCWPCRSHPRSPASHLPSAPHNPHGGEPGCLAAGSGSQPGHSQQRLGGSKESEALCCHSTLAYDLCWKGHMPLVTPALYWPHNQQEVTGTYLESTLVSQNYVARR